MNISRLSLTALLVGALLLPVSVLAQTPAPETGKVIVAATVNIYKARIITQQGNSFDVSFDISNRDGIQPNVKYSAFLIQKATSGQVVYGEQVYDETITLGVNSTVHKTITYAAPSQLSGVYELWLESRNTDGFPFASVYVDKVRLQPTEGGSATIDPFSCFLTVMGDSAKTHYALAQGVDIATTETLEATCMVKNTTNTLLTLTPSFVSHLRSQYGAVVEGVGGAAAPITVAAQESKEFTVALPKAANPQAYDIELTLTNGANTLNTNAVKFHYVLRGASATIQNVHWNKEIYQSGEQAMVSFMWSPSADSFSGSRAGKGTVLASPIAELSVVDEHGVSCGAPIIQNLEQHPSGFLQELSLVMTQVCTHPEIHVLIKDKEHGVLAEGHFATIPPTPLASAGSSTTMTTVIILVLIITGVIIFFVMKQKGKGSIGTPPVGMLFLALMIAGGMFSAVPEAHADTWYAVGDAEGQPYSTMFTTSLDSSSYLPGSPMKISWTISSPYCMNVTREEALLFDVDGSASTTAFNASMTGGDFIGSSNIVNVPLVPGIYNVNFTGTMGAAWGHGGIYLWAPTAIAYYSMPFTVVSAQPIPPPVVTVTQSPGSTLPRGQIGTIGWDATNDPDFCTVRQDGIFFASGGASGSVSAPIDAATTFTVQCTNAGGSGFDSASFALLVPVITLTPNPGAIIPAGTNASITWSVAWPAPNTPRLCVIEDFRTYVQTSIGTSGGTQNVGVLTEDTGFRIVCVDSGWGRGESPIFFTTTGSPPPVLSVSPTSVNFGVVVTSETKDKTITMTNTGSGILNVAGITPSAHVSCVSGCSATLGAGLSQVATLRMTAPATIPPPPGILPAETITVNSSNGGNEDVNVWGTIIPVITINPGPLDFGNVILTRHVDKELTIINNSGTIFVPAGNITVGAPFSCASSCAYPIIPPGGQTKIMMRYKPTALGFITGVGTLVSIPSAPQDNTGDMQGTGMPLTFNVIEK
jgi:hypothetical protein